MQILCPYCCTAIKGLADIQKSPRQSGRQGQAPCSSLEYADAVGRLVVDGSAERGIVVCGSGVGACIAANKIPGIYACLCHDTYSAHQGVEHDNMNVLCLGS
ncbi:MAG: RpiB/LacA/LacB family sugar-phosphate isomerase, partial [Chloroflexota bacterium]